MKAKDQPKISSEDINALAHAVQNLHECKAVFKRSVHILEKFSGATAWEGVVSVFELSGHPKATQCYAWSLPVERSAKRKFYAVLHIPPVNSPQDAVRAAIVSDHKENKT